MSNWYGTLADIPGARGNRQPIEAVVEILRSVTKTARYNGYMKEKISALLDDELSKREQDEALQTVSKDEELSDLWRRYNLIGAAFRREIDTHSPGLVRMVTIADSPK